MEELRIDCDRCLLTVTIVRIQWPWAGELRQSTVQARSKISNDTKGNCKNIIMFF